MTRTKYSAVEPDTLLKKIGLFNVQQLIDFETAVMVHKSLNDIYFLEPNPSNSHNTRSANYVIFPTHADIKIGQRSFSHYGCQVWNALPKDVQGQTNLNSLKKRV